MKIFKNLLPYIIIVVIVILLRCFVVEPVKVNGSSMEPTLEHNQSLLLNKMIYKVSDIKRFDIVVIDSYKQDDLIIKRIIGLPNETVSFIDNKLYINGNKVLEKYEHKNTYDFDLKEIDYEVIPEDMYFVVGDNRSNSQDSRTIGLISKKEIIGKVVFSFFPFNKIGLIK